MDNNGKSADGLTYEKGSFTPRKDNERRISWSVWVILKAVWVFSINFYLVLGFSMHMALLFPVRLISRTWYYWAEGFVSWFGNTVMASSILSQGYTIVEAGDDISRCTDDVTMLLANHQTPVDIVVLTGASLNKGKHRLGIMWLILKLFKWTHFGVSCQIRQDFFVSQGRAGREATLKDLKEHVKKNFIPLPNKKCILVYPEGGFLSNQKANSDRYAKKHDLPLLQHVSYPHTQAISSILNTFKISDCSPDRKLKWVVDTTMGYADGEPLSFKSVLLGDRPAFNIVLYYRIWPADEVPIGEEELSTWLTQRWIHKEKLLDEFYRTGTFPNVRDENNKDMTAKGSGNNDDVFSKASRAKIRKIDFNLPWFIFVNLTYMIAFILECTLLYWSFTHLVSVIVFIHSCIF